MDDSTEDVTLGYKDLIEPERGFHDLESTLVLRPVFHRVEPRVREHVLPYWLAPRRRRSRRPTTPHW